MEQGQEGHYIWRTVDDGKVRTEHLGFKDTIRAWADAPDPGEDYNCRCWAEPIPVIDDPPIEPFYPELLLLPLLSVPRLYSAWRLWRNVPKNVDWKLSSKKSETRWAKQIKDGDWTPEQITKTIKYGKQYPAANKIKPEHGATLYKYKDKYIVRDDVTGDILQISRPNFKHPSLPQR